MDRLKSLSLLMCGVLVALMLTMISPQPASAAACPCDLFGNTVPGTVDSGPDAPVKVGVFFHSDVYGYATGVRFYKSAANTGTHVGELWSVGDPSNKFRLASVTFTGETASGWQTATFDKPIMLVPNYTYMVSYNAPNGHYSYDTNYFNTPRSNSPLHVDAPYAAYVYTSAFGLGDYPFHQVSTNYWVDVVFEQFVNKSSLFDMTLATPAVPMTAPATPRREIGVRFTSDVNTTVTSLRFWTITDWYHPATINLWSSTGTLLATTEDPDLDDKQGWVEVYFNSPVSITAGTEYVASRFEDANQSFGYTDNFFTAPYDHGSFHAPANAGVYKDNTSSIFPDQQTSTNFWIDPVFSNDASMNVGATVDPSMTFTVAGRATVCNGQSSTNFQTGASATSVSLGHISSATVAGGAQDLSVGSNAAGGFNVYIRTPGTTPHSLRDGVGHSIADVSGTNASPGAAPVAGTAGFGYTTSDTSTAFTSDTWAALTNTNAAVITASPGTQSKSACIGYEAAVASTTPAGAYSTVVIYTAVPVF